ncbi:M48 family metallopeptidase [Aquabacterium sp. OR-4]|uniref:M48 family metallopeptidase n=1 Tax=Aquabacterium sp. OR-4 TaxID=2978127 RepID=UPI0021B33F45|nr:M48 family metallopeptidase [Aquabacterium sp. OR-4]MDT7834017.1 M48 family metallopeptidase [Aquabacterium sp. OR-4]
MTAPDPLALAANYFDGHSASPQAARLRRSGAELLIEAADDPTSPPRELRRVPWRQVGWPERSRHGQRQAYLPGHGLLVGPDTAAWDAWAAAQGAGPGWVNRWILSWRGVLATLVLAIAALPVGWIWGLPALASGVLTLVPTTVDAQLGDAGLAQFEREMLRASALPAARQAAIRTQFQQAVQRTDALHRSRGLPPLPPYTLHFHATPERGIGPNAFALPGGHIVLTDALAQLLDDRPEVLMGVLGHELGHVQHRHGMRMLVQGAAVAGISSMLLGDVSSLLALVPVVFSHAAYSRGFEFEADAEAARLLRANGHSPQVMTLLFDRLRADQAQRSGARRGTTGGDAGGDKPVELPIGLATHPPDAERVRRMVAAD